MGNLGKISRLVGGTTGSVMTFGSLSDSTSAPGQLPVKALKQIIQLLNEPL